MALELLSTISNTHPTPKQTFLFTSSVSENRDARRDAEVKFSQEEENQPNDAIFRDSRVLEGTAGGGGVGRKGVCN